MFFLGLFAGVAGCAIVALALLLSSVSSGKGLFALGGTQATIPSPSPSAPEPIKQASQVKPVDEKTDHVLGAKNAKVTLIEYSDFECPFCKRHFATMQQIVKNYPKDVRMVFRHFPLSFHQNAAKQAEASECAAELGGNDAFWKFHDKIFERTTSNGTGFALDALVPLAKEIGLNESAFKNCLDSGKMAPRVAEQMQEGSDAGVSGTPATFVNGKLISGALPFSDPTKKTADFKTIIDAALKK